MKELSPEAQALMALLEDAKRDLYDRWVPDPALEFTRYKLGFADCDGPCCNYDQYQEEGQ
jgi:hypothetical protein